MAAMAIHMVAMAIIPAVLITLATLTDQIAPVIQTVQTSQPPYPELVVGLHQDSLLWVVHVAV